jgi:LysM repeat protein
LEPDPAAAIYHYQQYLKLRPNSDKSEAVQGRITNCKQDLAKAVLPLPSSPSVQHELEQLILTNKQLRAELDQWRAWYAGQQTNRQAQAANPVMQPVQTNTQTVQVVDTHVPTVRSNASPVVPMNNSRNPQLGTTRGPNYVRTTYVVQSRDTLASISRKFNVKLDALAAANPGIDPRKIHPGQTVTIP